MTEYRVGNPWGVTIVREASPADHPCDDTEHTAQLVAVVVNGDTALAERICALLNGERAEPKPTTCGCPATYERARVERHTAECGLRKTAERLSAYLAEDHDEHEPQPADSCTCPPPVGSSTAPDPACPVHQGRRARGPKPPPVGPSCICDGSGRTCPRHGAVI